MNRRSFAIAASSFAAACANKKAAKFDYGEPKNKYVLKGVVQRLQPDTRVASIRHEKIEGWMEAMTMDFPVPDAAEFTKMKEGARIRATVCVNDLYYWLTNVTLE